MTTTLVERSPHLLESALLLTKETLRSERASFMTLTEDNRLRIDWGYGLPPDIQEGTKIPLSGVAGWVVENHRPLFFPQKKRGARRARNVPMRGEGYRTPYFLSVPVGPEERVLGVVNVADREDGKPFDHRDLTIAQLLAEHLRLCLEVNHLAKEVQKLALQDALTGAWNRRAFEMRLSEEMARTNRSKKPLALVLLDLDSLKSFNDAYGHALGDDLLCHVHQILKHQVRISDFVFRIGGDEFSILLPGTDLGRALFISGRLVEEASRRPIPNSEGKLLHFSTSLGVAVYKGGKISPRELVNRADRALYLSKASPLAMVHGWFGDSGQPIYLPWVTNLEKPEPALAKLFPQNKTEEWGGAPIRREANTLLVAFSSLPSFRRLRQIEEDSGYEIRPILVSNESLQEAKKSLYSLAINSSDS